LTHGGTACEDVPERILIVGVAVIGQARQFEEAIEAGKNALKEDAEGNLSLMTPENSMPSGAGIR